MGKIIPCPIPSSTIPKKELEKIRKKSFLERNKIMQEKARKQALSNKCRGVIR